MTVEFIKDEGATGNFEVVLTNSETLIHSKKGGKGRCETGEETQVGYFARFSSTSTCCSHQCFPGLAFTFFPPTPQAVLDQIKDFLDKN